MTRSKITTCLITAVGAVALMLSPSCNPCGTAGGETLINIDVHEFAVIATPNSALAGCITFHVVNTGDEDHEFLVIKTALDDADLPTNDNGTYQENGPGTTLVDEIAVIPPGQSRDISLNLTAGHYVLICNMFEEGEAHYSLGMHTSFNVQG